MFETWLFNFQALLSIYFWSIVLLGAHLRHKPVSEQRARIRQAALGRV